MKFKVKNIHTKLVLPTIPKVMIFHNEALNDSTEEISPGSVLTMVTPFLKDSIGVTFSCSHSTPKPDAPISEMELFNQDGYLLMTFERVDNLD